MSDLCRCSYFGVCRGAVCVRDLCPGRVSRKRGMSECPTRVSSRSVPQVPQECPTNVSRKRVKSERPTRVSSKSVLQECRVRVSSKSVLQECQVRVSYKSVK